MVGLSFLSLLLGGWGRVLRRRERGCRRREGRRAGGEGSGWTGRRDGGGGGGGKERGELGLALSEASCEGVW